MFCLCFNLMSNEDIGEVRLVEAWHAALHLHTLL